VDVAALESGDAADDELHNAYLNADPHMILVRGVNVEQLSETDRKIAVTALKEIRSYAQQSRSNAEKALDVSGGSSGDRALDKTRREHYCKAVARNYRAMIEAGSMLVSLYEPRLVEMYRTHSMR
jgi:hypothetical protein